MSSFLRMFYPCEGNYRERNYDAVITNDDDDDDTRIERDAKKCKYESFSTSCAMKVLTRCSVCAVGRSVGSFVFRLFDDLHHRHHHERDLWQLLYEPGLPMAPPGKF